MVDIPVEGVRDVCIVLEDVVHPKVRENIEAGELVVRGDVQQEIVGAFSFEQDAARIVEGFLWRVLGGGYHELLALHVATRSILATWVAASATVVV